MNISILHFTRFTFISILSATEPCTLHDKVLNECTTLLTYHLHVIMRSVFLKQLHCLVAWHGIGLVLEWCVVVWLCVVACCVVCVVCRGVVCGGKYYIALTGHRNK